VRHAQASVLGCPPLASPGLASKPGYPASQANRAILFRHLAFDIRIPCSPPASIHSAASNQTGGMAALRLLVVLLVAWLVLADFVVAREANPYPHRSAAILLGLILGEVGLVASWSALSRSSWLASAGMVWLTAAAAAWPMSLNTAPSWQAWAGLLLIYAGGVVAVWKILLAWGVHIDGLGERTQPPEGRLRSRQYSLARLMEITTAAAMTLGIGSWLALPSTEPYVAAASMLGL